VTIHGAAGCSIARIEAHSQDWLYRRLFRTVCIMQ